MTQEQLPISRIRLARHNVRAAAFLCAGQAVAVTFAEEGADALTIYLNAYDNIEKQNVLFTDKKQRFGNSSELKISGRRLLLWSIRRPSGGSSLCWQ